MSTQTDIFSKLKNALPLGWFSTDSTLIDAVCNAAAWAFALVYDNIIASIPLLRINTAFGGFLDLISCDFFGSRIPRYANETDPMFLSRIKLNMFRERGTRAAMRSILTDFTGIPPQIFEPRNSHDVCHLNLFYLNIGQLGSTHYPYQAFVTAYRPYSSNVLSLPGLDTFGMTLNQDAYLASGRNPNQIVDQTIFDAVELTKPYGTLIWVRIEDAPLSTDLPYIDINAITEISLLA